MKRSAIPAARAGKRLLAILLLSAAPGRADPGMLERLGISGSVDLRLAAADGETSWQNGGFGKARFSGGQSSDLKPHATIADAHLLWQPTFGDFRIDADLRLQQNRHLRAGLSQGWIAWKPVPSGATRYSARAGLFYAPISLEQDGPGWTTTRTITPSAINSWASEELKGVGLEGRVSTIVQDNEFAATVAIFGVNDTAGTLLAFRGWALNDVGSNAFQRQPLSPLSPFAAFEQPPFTTPVYELDNRPGYYVRVDWRSPDKLAVNAIWYDNRGDRVAEDSNGQWAWQTRFLNVGVSFDLDDRTQFLAQGISGSSKMDEDAVPGLIAFDIGFRSAYLLASRTVGSGKLTARGDVFTVSDHSLKTIDDNSEHGWAATVAYARPVTDRVNVMLEALHVTSNRPGRAYGGLAPHASQNQLQASLRIGL